MTTVVFGPSGNVGRHVLGGLLAAGEDVRAAAREPAKAGLPPGVPAARADLDRPDTLGPALDGAERAFLYAHPDGIGGFVTAARQAGLRRVVLLSSAAINRVGPEGSPIARRHRAVEVALEESGLEWTFLRGGMFATNTLAWWRRSIREESVVRTAYPAAHTAPVHEADIAAVAVAALTHDGHAGRTYQLWGSESVTVREQVAQIATAVDRPIELELISPDQARTELGRTMPPAAVEAVLGVWAAGTGRPAEISTVVAETTGSPARNFAQWAADHADDFR